MTSMPLSRRATESGERIGTQILRSKVITGSETEPKVLIIKLMIHQGIFKRRRIHSKMPGGFFNFEEEGTNTRLYGFGHGDHLRLRDEFGNIWRGTAEKVSEESVRYTFRDANGRTISGVSDSFGVVLRDGRGKTWRGFIE
jgi:hypothetical protein